VGKAADLGGLTIWDQISREEISQMKKRKISLSYMKFLETGINSCNIFIAKILSSPIFTLHDSLS